MCQLRCCQALPETSCVLSILHLVWWSLHPDAGNAADLQDPHQGPQKACSSHLDCPWALGVPVEAIGPPRPFLGSSSVRAHDIDESPLSQSEAVIAMRDFPIKAKP